MKNDEGMTIREYLLSKGINANQEKLNRKLSIDGEKFNISIDKPLSENIKELDIKVSEIFSLTYKVMDILKYQSIFNIAYIPKNLIITGNCVEESKLNYNISIYDSIAFNSSYKNVSQFSNIMIVDEIDRVEIERLY